LKYKPCPMWHFHLTHITIQPQNIVNLTY